MQSIDFSELALAIADARSRNHPRGAINVTVNHRPLLDLNLLTNRDGSAYSMTMIVQRSDAADERGPQRVRLPATLWIRAQGKSVTYRQAGRGNYTFNFYDAATGEHLCPSLVVAHLRQQDDQQRLAA